MLSSTPLVLGQQSPIPIQLSSEPVSPHIDTTWMQNNDKENNAPASTSILSPSLLPTLSNFIEDDEDLPYNNKQD